MNDYSKDIETIVSYYKQQIDQKNLNILELIVEGLFKKD